MAWSSIFYAFFYLYNTDDLNEIFYSSYIFKDLEGRPKFLTLFMSWKYKRVDTVSVACHWISAERCFLVTELVLQLPKHF